MKAFAVLDALVYTLPIEQFATATTHLDALKRLVAKTHASQLWLNPNGRLAPRG